MAGSITNTTFLDAFNQFIKAINDLTLAVNQINTTVNVEGDTITCSPDVNVSCGGGSGGSSTIPTDGGTDGSITLNPDPSNGTGETLPDGFDTWEEYNAYKCKVSGFIVDSLIGGFKWFANLGGLGIDTGVGGLAVWITTLLNIIKNMSSFARLSSYAFVGAEFELIFGYALVVIGGNPLAWLGIATALGTLLVLSIASVEYCNDIATLIETDKSSLVCALYRAANSTQAGAALRAKVLEHVTTVVQSWAVSIGETIGINTIMSIYDYIWADNRLLNLLFEYSEDFEARAISYSASCSSCNQLELTIYDVDTSSDPPTVVNGDLIYDEWITLESGSGKWGGNTWYWEAVSIKTSDNSSHEWMAEFISGPDDVEYQTIMTVTDGSNALRNWGASSQFTFSNVVDTTSGPLVKILTFECASINQGQSPAGPFRVRVKCIS